jgi:hypothetical protein
MNYIHKIRNIITHLDSCIEFKSPFCLIRFGDGAIKCIHSFLYRDFEQLRAISKREGIPFDKFSMLMEKWASTARHSDYIDTQEMYFDGRFWSRLRDPTKGMTKKTTERMNMWEDLYGRLEFENYNYCNPESNYLSVLRIDGWKNILDVMKNRKICLITAKPEVKSVLCLAGYDVDVIPIVGHFENQYENSFKKVMEYIEQKANTYDMFLVAAGELGRIYSGRIKELGGRTFDIGFIAEFWLGQDIHPRLTLFMERSATNHLELKLTSEGKIYEKFI